MHMAEHLCRAKRKDNGQWIDGYYVILHKTTVCCGEEPADNAVHKIVFEHMTDWNLPNDWLSVDVDPRTVCQFTGLRDNNGRMIFEGDIVLTQKRSDRPYSSRRKEKRLLGVVKWVIGSGDTFYDTVLKQWNKRRDYAACWCVDILNKEDESTYRCSSWGDFFDCEVIGNIYDNPEVLEGAK